MTSDLVRHWAELNGLTVVPEAFGLHELSENPPAGADQVRTPNAESATFLVDAQGQPSAIVFVSFGGQWMATMGELCRWMKLPAFKPPAPREDGDTHFIVVGRPGGAEPKWLDEQR